MNRLLDLFRIAPRTGSPVLRWVVLAACLWVGLVFLRAAVPKIADPAAFALAVFHYQVAPDALVNGVALFLPWLELVCGIAFILFPRYRAASGLLLIAMLLMFIGLQVSVIARGIDISCGCFSVDASDESRVGWMNVVRNSGLIALALLATWAHGAEGAPESTAEDEEE